MNTPIANILSGLLGGLVVLVVGAILISTDVIETGDSHRRRQSPITAPASDTGSAVAAQSVTSMTTKGAAWPSSRPPA